MFSVKPEEVLLFNNTDLQNIVNPVNVQEFDRLLVQSKYDSDERKYLIEGFTNGFSSGYSGSREVKKSAPNLKLRIGSPVELWNKVMLEVQKGRVCWAF